jgi:hypothetical protein
LPPHRLYANQAYIHHPIRIVEARRAVSAFALFEVRSFCFVDSRIFGATKLLSTLSVLQVAKVPDFIVLAPSLSVIKKAPEVA